MDDISQHERPLSLRASALRARLTGFGAPAWAHVAGTPPRLLARGLIRQAGISLLPFTTAPAVLTLSAFWAEGAHLRVTSAVLWIEAVALAHAGVCLFQASTRQSNQPESPTPSWNADDDATVAPAVSRLVGVVMLTVAIAATIPLVAGAGVRLALLAGGGLAIALSAVIVPLARTRLGGVNALLGIVACPGIALATVLTQGRGMNGSLLVLSCGLGLSFSAFLALSWARHVQATNGSHVSYDIARAGLVFALLAGFALASLSGLGWRPLAGAVGGLLAFPSILLAATGGFRAQSPQATRLARTAMLRAHWLLCALLFVGVMCAGVVSRVLA